MSHGPQSIYARRFAGTEAQRDKVWQILTRNYFQRWVRPTDAVLDLGAGYCDFFDHYLPLSDRSMLEAVELAGLRGEKVISRFLPFTMQGKMPPLPVFVRLYLLLPIFWSVLGKQFLIVARKPNAPTP